MEELIDLWGKYFGKPIDVDAYIKQLNQDIEGWIARDRDARLLLQEAHDLLDNRNAAPDSVPIPRCRWCGGLGYDSIQGLKHKDNCILVRIRHELSRP